MFYHRLFSNYLQVTEYASHIIIIILFPLKFYNHFPWRVQLKAISAKSLLACYKGKEKEWCLLYWNVFKLELVHFINEPVWKRKKKNQSMFLSSLGLQPIDLVRVYALNQTLWSWDWKKMITHCRTIESLSCFANSAGQRLRKCLQNEMENMHTRLIWTVFSKSGRVRNISAIL